MVVVVRGSPRGCMGHFLNELSTAYAVDKFGTRAIVPTSALADHTRSKIMGDAAAIRSSVALTLRQLADERMSSSPRAKPVISDLESQLLIRKIVVNHPEELPLFYRDGRPRLGLVHSIHAFISTLGDYRVDYPAVLGELQSAKSNQLAFILSEYRRELGELDVLDQRGVLDWAIGDIREHGVKETRKLFFFGLFAPTPSEREMITALCQACPDATYYQIHISGHPVFAEDISWLTPSSEIAIDLDERNKAMVGVFCGKKESQDAVTVYASSYANPLTELRQMAANIRRLLDEGEDPSSISVLLPMREKFAPMVREVMADHGIPASFSIGVGFSESPSIQAIFDLLSVVQNGYRTKDIIDLLSLPLIKHYFDFEGRRKLLHSWDVRELAQVLSASVGKDELLSDLPRTVPDPDRDDTLPTIDVSASLQVRSAHEGVRTLVKTLEVLEGKKTLFQHVSSLRNVLKQMKIGAELDRLDDKRIAERERRALALYSGLLNELGRGSMVLSDQLLSLDEFVEIHRTQVVSETYIPERAGAGAIEVTGLRAGQLVERKHVFIPAMVDGDLPRIHVSYPFATPEEVERMGVLVDRELLRQEKYYFLSALLSSTGHIYLSHHNSDRDKTALASPFLKAVQDALRTTELEVSPDLHSLLETQRQVGRAITLQDHNLTEHIGLEAIEAACRCINMEEIYRRGTYRSAYDGIMEAQDVVEALKLIHEGKTYSPSQICTYSYCPFQYYLKYVMMLQGKSVSRDVMIIGSKVHSILEKFYSERIASGKGRVTAPEEAEALEKIRAIALEQTAEWESQRLRASLNRLVGFGPVRGALAIFIEREVKKGLNGMNPLFLEHWIAPTDDDQQHHVRVPLRGDGASFINLAGRIDRVDAAADGRFFVIDYKTGSVSRPDAAEDLQIPLYIMAMEASNPGMKSIGGGYYVLTTSGTARMVPSILDFNAPEVAHLKGRIEGLPPFVEQMDAARKRVATLVEDIESGKFSLSHNGRAGMGRECGPSCDYYCLCRFDSSRLLDMAGGERDESPVAIDAEEYEEGGE